MFLWLEVIFSSFAAVAGTASIALTLISRISSSRAIHRKLREAQESRFQSVLESDDLTVVGHYLDDVIGNFNVYEYVSNPKVSKTVNSYLEKLRFFVGTDTEVEQQVEDTKVPPKIKVPPPIPDEFDKILTELRSGEVWNALARLRRHVEITLRKVAKNNHVILEHPSAGSLLNALSRSEFISKNSFSNLKYAVMFCNKAVHGQEVSLKEAEEAIFHASIGLEALKQS